MSEPRKYQELVQEISDFYDEADRIFTDEVATALTLEFCKSMFAIVASNLAVDNARDLLGGVGLL